MKNNEFMNQSANEMSIEELKKAIDFKKEEIKSHVDLLRHNRHNSRIDKIIFLLKQSFIFEDTRQGIEYWLDVIKALKELKNN